MKWLWLADMVCVRRITMLELQSAQNTSPEYLFCSSIFVGRRLFFCTCCTMSQTSWVMRAGWVSLNIRHSSLECCTLRFSLWDFVLYFNVDGVSQIFRSPEDWQWHCQTRFCTPTFRQFCRKVSARRRHWELGVSPSKRVCHTNAVLAPTPPRAMSPSAPVRTRN